MKKKMLGLAIGILLMGMNGLAAAAGDLIVDGKAGIGTLWPDFMLHIASDSPWIQIEDTSPAQKFRMGVTENKFYLFDETDYRINMVVDTDGNVGIGTATPEALLEVRSALPEARIKVRTTATDGNTYFVAENNAKRYIMGIGAWVSNSWLLWDETVGGSRITVAPGGDVAIGWIDPEGYKLKVYGTVYATGYYLPSDSKFKENIAPIESPLDKVLSIQGISFNWKKDEEFKDKGFPDGRHFGVIAEDIEKVLPEIVKESPKGEKAVAYGEIIPILVEAMKEQQKAIEALRAELDQLKAK